MTTADGYDWTAANQRYLLAALTPIRAALARRAGSDETDEVSEAELGQLASGMSSPPAAERLCGALRLSRFERSVLLLCVGVELDSGLARLCGSTPTFGLALAAFADAHWSALAPAAPLRRWRLVELSTAETLASAALRIDERVLHHLVGVDYLDERLEGILGAPLVARELPASHAALAARVARTWANSAQRLRRAPLVVLTGRDPDTRASIAALAATSVGMHVRTLHSDLIPENGPEREGLRRLCMREALLGEMALLVELGDADGQHERGAPVARFLDELGSTAIVSSDAPAGGVAARALPFEVEPETPDERRALWLGVLGEQAPALDALLDEIALQFDLGAAGITAAGRQLEEGGAGSPTDDLGANVWEACRAQSRAALDGLAQRIEARASWDDLVLPALQLEILHEMVAAVRHRAVVYERWGFARRDSRGLGVSALFTGASGTGKTMAAEVLGCELSLDLYRIDLSSVVSKYIGETEKNLRRVFDAAERSGAILLFDEADALFGKRTEVKDSHDRYANIEVSYLLQRMEAYRGLAILTTNFRSALDQAFLRRLRFVVEFPFPSAEQREQIWRRIFPVETPTASLDASRLAQLQVTGGNIRNIALRAGFLAAGDGGRVEMGHLLRAARGEYAKLERSLTGAEMGGWS